MTTFASPADTTGRVLMVDDETELAASTVEYLAAFGLKATYVTTAEKARIFLRRNPVDLILLDINLPDGSGFQLCRELRAGSKHANTPIIFLTARQTDDDEILALSIGGDDYVRKPYSLAVLLAKVRRMLARRTVTTGQVTYDDGRLKLEGGRVFINNTEIVMTAMEYRLLDHLVANQNNVVSKADLFEHVWQEPFTSDGTLNVHIRRLRKHIEPNPDDPTYVKTVWGRGYLFQGQI
ncbi:MAG: response regulator transcription factor [Actinomycetaceae bacterium]|nr:response regulator transcription factor [Actinomycetaceae bacterium]